MALLSAFVPGFVGLAHQPGCDSRPWITTTYVGSVIAGATSPEKVRANAAAVRWTPTDEDLAILDTITTR